MPPPGSHNGTSSSNGAGGDFFNPRNAEDVFAEFFSGNKPYGFEAMSRAKSMRFQSEGAGTFGGFGGAENKFKSYKETGGGAGTSQPRKPPPVEAKVPCTLEELYTGTARKMKISRTVWRNGYATMPFLYRKIIFDLVLLLKVKLVEQHHYLLTFSCHNTLV